MLETRLTQLGGSGAGSLIGGVVVGGTVGSILFIGAGGTLAQNNANFFWDNTNLRVGIGTTTPGRKFEVYNAADALAARYTMGTLADVTFDIYGQTAAGGIASIGTQTNSDFRIFTNAIDRLTILKSGNVGIGITNPNTLFQVAGGNPSTYNNSGGAGAGYRFQTFTNGAGSSSIQIASWGALQQTSGTRDAYFAIDLSNTGAPAEVFRINAAGSVGIGTTSPGAMLQINSQAAGTKGIINRNAASQTANNFEAQNSSGTVYFTIAAAGAYYGTVDAIGTIGASTTLDVTKGNVHTITSTASTNMTITPSAAGTAGQHLWIIITSDATGGDVITFASTFKPNGTMTLTASKGHTIHFISDGTNWWEVARTLAL